MDVDDARFERPCKLMLAFAALVHWVGAAVAFPWYQPEGDAAAVLARLEGFLNLLG